MCDPESELGPAEQMRHAAWNDNHEQAASLFLAYQMAVTDLQFRELVQRGLLPHVHPSPGCLLLPGAGQHRRVHLDHREQHDRPAVLALRREPVVRRQRG